MNCAILTSDKLRHIFFANKLAKINPKALLYESKINNFSEGLVFEDHLEFDNKLKRTEIDNLNCQESFNMLNSLDLDFIFIFGCRLLSEKIISCAKKDVINIHTGLTQHHRGVDSPHWAFIENRPELIGYTIHSVTPGIDDGKVYFQGHFTDFNKNDNIDTIFLKNCKKAINHLSENVNDILNGRIRPQKYNKGKLYQTKDMSEAAKKTLTKNLKSFLDKI
tara:strand:+ start:994 stop:1656 length:663 start_codon:yes stop_codon:yes gene_type:complete